LTHVQLAIAILLVSRLMVKLRYKFAIDLYISVSTFCLIFVKVLSVKVKKVKVVNLYIAPRRENLLLSTVTVSYRHVFNIL